MAKIILKHEEGVLHIGGGRFFYAKDPVEVTEEEKAELLEKYEDLQEFVEAPPESEPEKSEEKPKGKK